MVFNMPDAQEGIVEEIVISGMSGRFPQCDNMEELKQKLLEGIDLVTEGSRWPIGIYGLPTRNGTLKDLSKFDATFFGVHSKQAEAMDPQLKMLLELTHEAIVDAGINPSELRGSKTGVFIACSVSESLDLWTQDPEAPNRYYATGCLKSMLANRISYNFDFNGPSYVIDTACSSGLFAFQNAITAFRTGQCNAAVIGGVNLILKPSYSVQFSRLNMLSSDGKCKSFDASANGYARSEAAAVVFLQKTKTASRVYATVLGTGTGTDGYKEQGVTFPSGEMQSKLIKEVYQEFKVDSSEVSYVEAHGTGTPAGDPEEVNRIADFFCKNRKEPLLIGSVKSNLGHSEVASAFCSIAKVVIAMETDIIPANLHYNSPNSNIPALTDGRLKVVSENQIWKGGIVGINSFGFGGANAHAILKSNPLVKLDHPADVLPRLVGVSGCTEDAVHFFLDRVERNKADKEFLALLNRIHKDNITGHRYRGYTVLDNASIREVTEVVSDIRPVWFVYSGLGSQWAEMGKQFMQIETFKNSIKTISEVLKPYNVNVEDLVTKGTDATFSIISNTLIAITAIQIALTDTLSALGIIPDGVVGHSTGETACGYADGSLTARQTILASYFRGQLIQETEIPSGAMAVVGLTWEEATKRCPADVYPACHNSRDNVTVSGPTSSVARLIEQLKSENIFAAQINSCGFAFHSKYISVVGPKLLKTLKELIPHPKPRSAKWVSSSIPQSDWETSLAKYNSPEYQVHNLLSPVLFYDALQHIPENAIVIEIAPSGLFQSILKKTLGPRTTNISLSKRKYEHNLQFLLSSIGKIYNAGAQPNFANLYDPVRFPVSKGTPMIAPLIKWDHSVEWPVASYSQNTKSSDSVANINLGEEDDMYLAGHAFDGRILFPATGYLVLVWKAFAKLLMANYEQLPIVFEDIKFHRAVVILEKGSVEISISIFEGSGTFELCESSTVVVTGKATIPENVLEELLDLPQPEHLGENFLPLDANDIYAEFRLRGYGYGGPFCGILKSDNMGNSGKLKWNNNWVCYMDTMLQFSILGHSIRKLYVPTMIQKVVINPKEHLEYVNNLPDEDHPSIYRYQNINVIKSGGIEVRGIESSIAPRRPQVDPGLKLEKYQFVPFENAKCLSNIQDEAKLQSLTVLIHIVLENSAGALKVKIAEIANGISMKLLLTPTVKTIVETELPLSTVDATVVATRTINDVSNLEDTDIKFIQKDTLSLIDKDFLLVVLTDILTHNKINLAENFAASLKPGGFILLEESKKDIELSNTVPGFIVISTQVTDTKLYVLLRKPLKVPLDSIVVRITEQDFRWVEPLKKAMETSENNNTKVYIYVQGEELSGLVGMVNGLKQEPGGFNIRAVFIQDTRAKEFTIANYSKQLEKDLVHNVLKNNIWGSFRHLLLERDNNKRIEVEHAYINTLTRGDLSSLRWIEGPRLLSHANNSNKELCTVYYAALNFRDVMLASGRLPPDSLPDNAGAQDCILGCEFSGRSSQGQRVMGIVSAKSLATTVLADPDLVWNVPDKWNLEEASTIPVAYGTSYYALIVRGQMRPGESILIHAGAGGVGQASIAIALHMGCKVFTTVGSQTKRDFLKSRFPQLSDACIGCSRNASFEQLVLGQTKGRGVDLILNSLTTYQLQASIRCLAIGGRFLEIGKMDLSNNSPLGMRVFLKNSTFHGVLLDALFNESNKDRKKMRSLLSEGIINGVVTPLPRNIFNEDEAEQAFRYMASGNHIGKVIIKIRGDESKTKIKTISAIPRMYMFPEKSYIVVGGLGGLGLELVEWIISKGATKLVISSTNGIRTGYQSLCVRRWKEAGNVIFISTLDLTIEKNAKTLMKEANNLGPIGGIFNLAAVIRDAMIENLTEADFELVTKPKIDLTKQLDVVSRVLAPDLDYFVFFSSYSSGRGIPGQSNYGLANSAGERICEARRKIGLPGLAIQWGAIADVGLVIKTLGANVDEKQGMRIQKVSSFLTAMEVFLQQPDAVVSSMVIAKKQKKTANASKVGLREAVAKLIGINDASLVAPSATLVNVGMDSLMGTEIKQLLERDFDIILNVQEIRSLTFEHLLELESKSTPVKTNFEIMPIECLVQIPSKTTQSKNLPVYMIHPVEGLINVFQQFASKVEAAVYGLQCTNDTPVTSIPSMAQYYIEQIKTVQNEGPYTLVGYSFGACIAYEMSIQLQRTGDQVKLLLIDGSPAYVASYMVSYIENDEAVFQSKVLGAIVKQFKVIDYKKVVSEFKSLQSWEERLARANQIATNSTSSTLFKTLANSFRNRLFAGAEYRPNAHFKGSVTLVKASENSVKVDDDYGLSKICDGTINVKSVEGNHESILSGAALEEIVKVLHDDVIKK